MPKVNVSRLTRILLLAVVTPVIAAAALAATEVPARLATAGVAVDQTLLTGLMAAFGLVVALVLGFAWGLMKIFDARFAERMTIYMADDTLPFGRHRVDPDAHGKLKDKIEASFKIELKALHDDNQAMENRHHATMQALMSIMQPIVEQNAEAMRIMQANMRRQPRDS